MACPSSITLAFAHAASAFAGIALAVWAALDCRDPGKIATGSYSVTGRHSCTTGMDVTETAGTVHALAREHWRSLAHSVVADPIEIGPRSPPAVAGPKSNTRRRCSYRVRTGSHGTMRQTPANAQVIGRTLYEYIRSADATAKDRKRPALSSTSCPRSGFRINRGRGPQIREPFDFVDATRKPPR